MTRRLQHYSRPEWYPWTLAAGAGVLVMLAGAAVQVAQLVVSVRTRDARRAAADDPWDGRNLEWATPSPPPAFNFAVLPQVDGLEPWWRRKHGIGAPPAASAPQAPIHMPRNTPTGFVTAFFAVATGFALIWRIWWLAGVGLLGAYATFVVFAWRDRGHFEIAPEEARRIEQAHRAHAAAGAAGGVAR